MSLASSDENTRISSSENTLSYVMLTIWSHGDRSQTSTCIDSCFEFNSVVGDITCTHMPYSREYKYPYFYSKSVHFLQV